VACDCCNLPCTGHVCCCPGDCCTEDISCILVSIDGCGTTEISAAGPNALCAAQTFSGPFTCTGAGASCGTIEMKCGPAPDGLVARILMDASCFRINANGNYECRGTEVPPDVLPYTSDSGWFGTLNYACCPFFIDDCFAVAEICDCTCLKQEPVVRASSAVKCPPMGGAAMKRMLARAPKETEAAGRLVERVGPFPHPCPRHRRLAEPCGRAQRGLYTKDQCHWCWWYENNSGYRMLWGGDPIVHTTVTRKVVYADGRKGETTRSEQTQRRMPATRRRGLPGTELKDMLAAIGVISATGTCNCDPHVATMNEWGWWAAGRTVR
jgi:hypothetical protein